MATEKVNSIIHSPNDVAHFGHYLNYCCEAPEKGHKVWVGQQGEKTNQGPEAQLTMMIHSMRKEASAVLCEAVQGEFLFIYFTYFTYFTYLTYDYTARIDDEDPGFENDNWMKKRKQAEEQEPLRADRWYYKNMDGERDNPEQSGCMK